MTGGCDVNDIGTVRYYLLRLNQDPFELTIKNILHVPSCPKRLYTLSTAATCRFDPEGTGQRELQAYEGGATLTHKGEQFHFTMHAKACLPLMKALHSKEYLSQMAHIALAEEQCPSDPETILEPHT